MPNILITGSSGFVGRMARKRFEEQGWNVFGVGRRLTQQQNYFQADLSQPIPRAIFDVAKGCDVVLHAAARSSPWGRQKEFYLANVVATENVIDLCQRCGSPKLIFVSSSSVFYRDCDQLGMTETAPFADKPVNHYAATKQVAERILAKYDGPSVIVRPRAVYGHGDTVLFPRILAAAKAGKLPLIVRKESEVVGDLISIENLCDHLFQIASQSSISGAFNLTDNDPQPIIRFLNQVLERLLIPQPTWKISAQNAYRLAWWIENVNKLVCPWREPTITRFGIHVFAFSKTFDVSKMLNQLGPPRQSTDQAVQQFVQWFEAGSPEIS
ncbi:MAG: NAD-dependent epimerase/dehydratase family protein [Planctomycetota bacterium]